MQVLLDKLTTHFVNVNNETFTDGLEWYNKAYKHARYIKANTSKDISLKQVIGVIAALSPRNKWARNKQDALALINGDSNTKVCTFDHQKDKALSVIALDWQSCTSEGITNILKGTKTVNFYNNILYRGKNDGITVDVWAYRSLDLTPSPKNYKVAEAVYRELSEIVGLELPQLQAVIWGEVRGKIA